MTLRRTNVSGYVGHTRLYLVECLHTACCLVVGLGLDFVPWLLVMHAHLCYFPLSWCGTLLERDHVSRNQWSVQ